MEQPPAHAGYTYSVCVQQILDEGWVRALGVQAIATHRYYTATPRTVFTLAVADQAELLGLLTRLHDLGLRLLSVELDVVHALRPAYVGREPSR